MGPGVWDPPAERPDWPKTVDEEDNWAGGAQLFEEVFSIRFLMKGLYLRAAS